MPALTFMLYSTETPSIHSLCSETEYQLMLTHSTRPGSIQVSTARSHRRLFVSSSNNTNTPKMGARQTVQAPLSGLWVFPVATLQSLINLNIKVKAGHFHKFWRVERPPAEDSDGLPFLHPPAPPPDPEWQEPAVVVTRGRPRRADNSTRRDASSWEVATSLSTRKTDKQAA